MKKKLLLFPLFIIGILISFNACESANDESTDPEEEVCVADKFCEIEMTTCCVGETCVYKYKEKEYPQTDAGEKELYAAMSCTAKKSLNAEENFVIFKIRLQELREQAISMQMMK